MPPGPAMKQERPRSIATRWAVGDQVRSEGRILETAREYGRSSRIRQSRPGCSPTTHASNQGDCVGAVGWGGVRGSFDDGLLSSWTGALGSADSL